jgi:hypothetical protein
MLKLQLYQGDIRFVKTWKELEKVGVFNLFYFMDAMNILPRKLFIGLETWKKEDD